MGFFQEMKNTLSKSIDIFVQFFKEMNIFHQIF